MVEFAPNSQKNISYLSLLLGIGTLAFGIYAVITMNDILDNIQSIDTSENVVNLNFISIENINHLQTHSLKGELITKEQPNITSIGQQDNNLNVGGKDVVDVLHAEGRRLYGTLTPSVQNHVTSLGVMHENINMNNNSIFNVNEIIATNIGGSIATSVMSSIVEIGQQTSDLNAGSQNITNVSAINVKNNRILTLSDPVRPSTTTNYSMYFPTTTNTNTGITITNSSVLGTLLTIGTSGMYSISCRNVTMPDVGSNDVHYGIGRNAVVTISPGSQKDDLLDYYFWKSGMSTSTPSVTGWTGYLEANDVISFLFHNTTTNQCAVPGNGSDWLYTVVKLQ